MQILVEYRVINNLQDAYKNAYLTDSVSAFGGVIALIVKLM